jgi:hypothetical protein
MICGPLLLSATTVLIGPDVALLGDFGIFTQAKSREGSQISDTAFGKYPPTVAANDFPTVWDVRRIMLANVGFAGFRSGVGISPMLSPNSSVVSWLTRLLLRPRVTEGGPVGPEETLLLRLECGVSRRKMWTVSVADETLSSVDLELNDMLNILAGMEPLRNWYSFCASGIEKTRMMVPFSDAVANSVPSLLSAMQDKGEL